ncbi:MAG: TonB family protein [Fluviicola sp.]|jgi:TonB family protein|uniref:TonB family protein n=1 Tax=Fluviicola sp. TaxID=1917219 RepID=UPI002635F8CF|nr:TonB family protein [Fluviicola sp.]MDF3025726.1 TonB family protein [Fluviicola sp.]
MTNYLWTIFEVNVLITLLFCVFKLIQRYLSFGWQRISLLSIPLLSILAVWMKQRSISESSWSYHIPVIELETVEISGGKETSPRGFDYTSLPETVYWLGVVLLTVWMLYKLYKILRGFSGARRTAEDGFTVIESADQAPSSFFHIIQLPSGLSKYDREIIFQHEKIHAQKFHSADRLYLETVHCLSWFNPLILLMKKELVHIHEFEVDRIMYTKYRAGYMEFLLAYSLGTSSSFYLFTNQFMTKLTLIKRIKIMKNTSKKVLIAALALPVIAGGLTLISFTAESKQTPPKETKKEKQEIKREAPKKAPSARTVKPSETTKEKIIDPKSETPGGKDVYFVIPMETTSEVTTEPQETEVDKMPEYPGGTEAMIKYLTSNIRYPEVALKEKTTGKVFVSFVVAKDGKVTKATIKKGVSKELDAEALRVVSAMPKWNPAEKDGKKVDAEMVLPVSFAL